MRRLPREFWLAINTCYITAALDRRDAVDEARKAEFEKQIAFFDKIRADAYEYEHEQEDD